MSSTRMDNISIQIEKRFQYSVGAEHEWKQQLYQNK